MAGMIFTIQSVQVKVIPNTKVYLTTNTTDLKIIKTKLKCYQLFKLNLPLLVNCLYQYF